MFSISFILLICMVITAKDITNLIEHYQIVVPVRLTSSPVDYTHPKMKSDGDDAVVEFKLLDLRNIRSEVKSFCEDNSLLISACEGLLLEVTRQIHEQRVAQGLEKQKLADFTYNKYSQFGEDGIIQKIFAIMGRASHYDRMYAVEFGAWDGFHLSNTANLWFNNSSYWMGVLIEADEGKFQDLTQRFASINDAAVGQSIYAVAIQHLVQANGSNSLDRILSEYSIPLDQVDLISIDIDGDDYYILQSILASSLKPRLIVCEYNPTMPAHLDMYGAPGSNLGASVSALTRLANEKNYSLIALTKTNAFFVSTMEYVTHFTVFETSLQLLRIDDNLRYVITDYSGRYKTVADVFYINSFGTTQEFLPAENILGQYESF
jgi:hypothetical protein